MPKRCHDCFGETTEWFVTFKRMRDIPADTDPAEACFLDGMCFDEVLICSDCAGWYGEDAMPLTPEEAAVARE